MDPLPHNNKESGDVFEVSPPENHRSDKLKQKEEETMANNGLSSFGLENGCQSSTSVSYDSNLEGHAQDLFVGDEELDTDIYADDLMEVNEYALLQTHFDKAHIPAGVEAPLPWMPTISSSSLRSNIQPPPNAESSNSGTEPISEAMELAFEQKLGNGSFPSYEYNLGGSSSNSSNFHPISETMELAFEQKLGDGSFPSYEYNLGGSSSNSSNFHTEMDGGISPFDYYGFDFNPYGIMNFMMPPFEEEIISFDPDPQGIENNRNNLNEDEVLKKFELFKQFDIVDDHSDNHYAAEDFLLNQPPKSWAKAIHEEWRMLKKNLPNNIYVRIYESRMDLMRAVIIGAEGTPYHDGLFFFDVLFPCGYPAEPPLVHYRSGGLRINPNLYHCGKVCLSLLNTWLGNGKELWMPGVSNMLQVLISIQALILNAKPFFNEPGFEMTRGTPSGETKSEQYNEDTFIKSLRTMLYTVRRPPAHFEDLVNGHFFNHAHDVLAASKAYMNGAPIGSLIEGGVEVVDEHSNKSCSRRFKDNVGTLINMLVQAFTKLGVKDCEKFLIPEPDDDLMSMLLDIDN